MLDLEDSNTFIFFITIPKWIQDRIKQAENFESSGLKKWVEENVKEEASEENGEYVTVDEDELPF